MTHYELPVMRDWFEKVNDVQALPGIHIQAMYNVTVSEISEDSEATISYGQTTEVPQGWSHGLDINSAGHFVVNLPGRDSTSNNHLTLHASIKLFVAMDDMSLNLGSFHIQPVFAEGSSFARNVFYHYLSAGFFKIGWVVGSLDILGSPAGFIRNVSQGFADFFYFPYDGLTRGPGAFVSGMSQGVSSFVRHISTGALTSVTNLASSISRNLDKLSMDEGHIRLQEEQRSRRPTRLMTGITHGLGGFGLSLLGAVAGVVDQPIQGIQRANDVRQAATGILTGVGKGLVGVVTKPLGGAMELVSQAGRGILRGTGLSHLPTRLRPVEESIELISRNSHLKYSWKILNFKTNQNLLLCTDVTVVTSSGHDYSGALLLTSNTLYIANSVMDAVQQALHIQDTDLQKDDSDHRIINVTSVISHNFPENMDDGLQTGDRERLEQFLRDAQAFARVSRNEGTSLDSPGGSVFTSTFMLIVDPVLRETLLSQFKTLKYNLMVDDMQI
ncbi:hypothetical protein QZH41_018462 [Actinostola sp. cb2023]|nr:hypothetical protein QZH41_018462 [Actinostola sp. cb2023]